MTTYLGGQGVYQVRSTRIELLRAGYGFTCRCALCSDNRRTPDGMKSVSDAERDVMVGMTWGLDQWSSGSVGGNASTNLMKNAFLPATDLDAFHQAETLVALMLRQNLLATELQKAYHKASVAALAIKDYNKSILYARNEAQVERNCLGAEVGDLRQLGVAAECWWVTLLDTIRAEAGDAAVREYLQIPGVPDGNSKGKGKKKGWKGKGWKKQKKDRSGQQAPSNWDKGPDDKVKESEGTDARPVN